MSRPKTGGRVKMPGEERLALGKRVRDLREALAARLGRSVPQAEIAARGGFDRTVMVAFEKGNKLSPHDNREKLAVGFGLPTTVLDDLIGKKITAVQALAHIPDGSWSASGAVVLPAAERDDLRAGLLDDMAHADKIAAATPPTKTRQRVK